MRWATDYTAPVLSHEMTMRYLALRRARRIGMLWSDAGVYSIAELGNDHGPRHPITVPRLIALIEATEAGLLSKDDSDRLEEENAECAA